MMNTDQGPIVGDAAVVARTRANLCPEVEIWADVMVKHATPPPGSTIEQAARDTMERGMADALVISGSGTGTAPELAEATRVKSAVEAGTRLVIGSGATSTNLSELLTVADTVIVGSSTKVDGIASNPVDPDRATMFAEAARGAGLV